MPPKTIILDLFGAGANEAHVKHAIALAKEYGAHVHGINMTPEYTFPAFVMADVPVEIIESQRASAQEASAKTIAAFNEMATEAGISHSSQSITSTAEGLPTAFARLARTGDLLVLGQHNPDDDERISTAIIEAALFGSGRPVLIVPYIGAISGTTVRHAIVAWDGSATSARAAHDALPVIEKSQEIEIVSVMLGNNMDQIDEGGRALAESFSRHGLKARYHSIPSGGNEVANALLSHASDAGADLLVMGGYGHSRVREFILGGATREILSSMTVPVLMSH